MTTHPPKDDADLIERAMQHLAHLAETMDNVSRHYRTAQACYEDAKAIRTVLATIARLQSERDALREAGRELLSGHDNLYLSVFGEGSDPTIDIAAKPMRAALGDNHGG